MLSWIPSRVNVNVQQFIHVVYLYNTSNIEKKSASTLPSVRSSAILSLSVKEKRGEDFKQVFEASFRARSCDHIQQMMQLREQQQQQQERNSWESENKWFAELIWSSEF